MSLKLNSSGGGSITLQEPSTASNRTLTLPDNTGNLISSADSGTITQGMLASGVGATGPTFSVYRNTNQSFSATTWTKVQLNTEVFDTANNFDNSTNYRFTPTVAGYYQINGHIQFLVSGTLAALAAIYKNGSVNAYGSYFEVSSNNPHSHVSTVVYLNGSTDYVELYGLSISAGNFNGSIDAAASTYMSGSLVRAA